MRKQLRFIGVLAVAVLVTTACMPFGPPPRTGPPQRGGSPTNPSHRPTGFFHTRYQHGRWTIVDPEGRDFYSLGVNHVTATPDVDRTTGRCPYCDAIALRYPDTTAWADTVVARLTTWGFNTIGAWSDYDRFSTRLAYTPILNMAGGDDWFSPAFEARAAKIASTQVAPRRDDPNLLGWFLDNELHWGPDYRSDKPLLDDYLALPEGSPGRAVAEQHTGDPSGFLRALATRYYQVTTGAIRAVDPHHMILGTRLIGFMAPPEVVETARPYLDVLSVNAYTYVPGFVDTVNDILGPFVPLDATLSKFHELSGLPVILSEYGFRAADAGLPNSWPPIYVTYPTQTDRANAWAAQAEALYASPWIVGDHWFEYVDEPPGGRSDGEDDNWGLVSNDDTPWQVLVDRMTAVHADAPGTKPGRGR